MAAVIGALRAELSASIAAFQSDLGKAAGSLKAFSVEAKAIGAEMVSVGTSMALAITGPLLLMTKASVDQALQMRAAMGQVTAALTSTGGVSGRTADQLKQTAQQLENISTFDKSDILKDVTANLLRFGNISGSTFDRAEKAIVNMAARNGDLAGSTLKVGRALNDPIKGITALTRAGIQFTTAEKDQIKQLVQNHQGFEAQNLILEKLEEKFNGAAAAARAASPTAALNQAWRDLKETIGEIVLKDSQPLIDFLTTVVKRFQDLTPAMQSNVVKWGAIAAAAGPLVVVLGSVVKVIGTLAEGAAALGAFIAEIDFAPLLLGLGAVTAPMIAIGAALVAVGVFIYEFRDKFLAAIDEIWKEAQTVLGPAFQKLLDSLAYAWSKLVEWLTALWQGPLGQFFRSFMDALASLASSVLAVVGKYIIDVLAGFLDFLAKSVTFIVDNLDLVIKFLSGDWAGAWKAAANVAADAMAFISSDVKPGAGPKKPVFAAPPKPKPLPAPGAPPAAGGGGTPDFDLHNEDTIKKLADATKAFEDSVAKMQDRIAKGLDDLTLPKSISQANDLNRQIDDFVKKAQDAGVNTSKWATQIAALRARIDTLKIAGLAKEAKAFAEQVDADAVAVDRFGHGGLPPLQEKLQAVDDQYKSLRDKIQGEIDANKALAASNTDAADTMAKLQKILDGLGDAHKAATAAAIAQYNAEQTLADLKTKSANLETSNQIQDFMAASGRTGGPISSSQQDLQTASRDLAKQQIDTETQLQQLIADRAKAVASNDDKEAARLTTQIDLQQQLYDLVSHTTAEQLEAARRINDAFKSFTDSLSSDLSDMVVEGKFDFKTLLGDFTKLGEELFVKPLMDQLSNVVGGFLKNLLSSFAGGFAGGGWIGPSQWGIVGEEGPELARGGVGGTTILPSGSGGGGTAVVQNFNIRTPDVGGFRRTQRQIARSAKSKLGMT